MAVTGMNFTLLLPELILVATGILLVLLDLFTEQKRVLVCTRGWQGCSHPCWP